MQQGKIDKSNEKCHNCWSQLHPSTSITRAHKLLFHQSISIIITVRATPTGPVGRKLTNRDAN